MAYFLVSGKSHRDNAVPYICKMCCPSHPLPALAHSIPRLDFFALRLGSFPLRTTLWTHMASDQDDGREVLSGRDICFCIGSHDRDSRVALPVSSQTDANKSDHMRSIAPKTTTDPPRREDSNSIPTGIANANFSKTANSIAGRRRMGSHPIMKNMIWAERAVPTNP